MTSRRLRLIGGLMRPVVRTIMAFETSPFRLRRSFELSARIWFRRVPGAAFTGDRHGLWVRHGAAASDRVILYLHGGAYMAGSPRTHRNLVARLAGLAGLQAFIPVYRLAPEDPPPACLEDALGAFDRLRADGWQPQQIVIGGDSAGGGLALSLLSLLCQRGTPPAGCFAWSPFCDMTFSGASVRENGRIDHFFPAHRVHDLTEVIIPHLDPADPRVSPLFARFPGCPPVFIQVGSTEILRDDARRMTDRLRQFGADATLREWQATPHVWQIFDGWFPEARAAIAETAEFIATL